MIHTKPATTGHPVLEVIQNRWSPLAFSNQSVETEKVMCMLEAARWAPSSFNEQPWRYIIGHYADGIHAKLCECLFDGNNWARNAGVLILSVAKMNFSYNNKPNRFYLHDVGAASAYLVLQATVLDLITHQMEGFYVDKARELFKIGGDYEPGSMIAIGYPGGVEMLSDQWKEREQGVRSRKTVDEILWK